MTISEKLITIAGNMQKVYDAGYAKGHITGIDVEEIMFDDWNNSTSDEGLVMFSHKLGVKPKFVAIIADDITQLKEATLPDGIDGTIIQTDALYNSDADEYFARSYVRRLGDSITSATLSTANRLIAKWDDKYVYVNSAASTYAWAPSSVTTFTMICYV